MIDAYKEYALKIALKFMQITSHRGFEEYSSAIRSNLLQMLTEDKRENFRRLIAERLDFGSESVSLAFLAKKTTDQSTAVRLACY